MTPLKSALQFEKPKQGKTQQKGKAKKSERKSLVNGELKNVIEMCYWLVKFVGDYEKVYHK